MVDWPDGGTRRSSQWATIPREGSTTARPSQRRSRETRPVEADVRDPAAIERLVETAVEEYGRIDVLVNNVAKAGVNGLTRALAVELGPLDVRAKAIDPGAIDVEDPDPSRGNLERDPPIDPAGRIGTSSPRAADVFSASRPTGRPWNGSRSTT